MECERGSGAGTPTEDGINDVIGRLQRGRKIIDKRDVEVLELFGESLRTRISGLAVGREPAGLAGVSAAASTRSAGRRAPA